MNDPGQYQNIDPQMLQMIIANAIGPQKQGVTQNDINPIQDIIMSQMLGMPVNKPVNEDLIRSVNAPQWSAMANYTYKDTDIEPKIMQLIGQGIPLTEVKKKIKEELALQGLPTDSKNEQVKNLLKLSDTLYSEFTNSNSKILEAKQSSLTNSPYTKFGVSDPSDYNKIDNATLAELGGPDAAGSVAQTLGLNQIVKPAITKPVKPAKTMDDVGFMALARTLNPVPLLKKIPIDSRLQYKDPNRKTKTAQPEPRTQQEAQLFDLVKESSQKDFMTIPLVTKFNEMNAAKSANIAQMVAENRRQQIDANSASTASNKSNQDIMKKLILMKVMGNPKLLANPAIQQALGS